MINESNYLFKKYLFYLMENFLNYSKFFFCNRLKTSSTTSINFWNLKNPTIEDMCGGLSGIHDYDILSTELAISKFNTSNIKSVLEVGCGIGRISTNILFKYFENIDLLERKREFLIKAEERCKNLNYQHGKTIFRDFYNSSIEDFTFKNNYDLIFIQWVLEYLTDENLDEFLIKVYNNLNHQGVLIIKENVNEKSEYWEDEGSHIREISFFEERFKRLNLKEIYSEKVDLGRTDLYDVQMWCLSKI